MNYWVQEASLGVARQAIIHLGDCPLCEEGKKTSAQDRWYGPFPSLTSAREISDELADVAMRAECRCVRKVISQDLASVALLNEPLFRKPAAPREEKKSKKTEAKKPLKPAAAKAAQAKRSRRARYAFVGVAAVSILTISLFVFPALSVVEASSHSSSTPFLLANDGLVPVTNLNAECTVELQPAAVRLQNTHQQLTERLGSKNQVTIPCFQASGGRTPQINGLTVHMTVSYAVFGIHHVQQTFSFVAARTADGICRWVNKG